jgi:hypothetical protein
MKIGRRRWAGPTNVREDYTVLGIVVCAGALRHWRFRRHEGRWSDRPSRTSGMPHDVWGRRPHKPRISAPYALALHVYKVRLFPQYRDPKSVIPSLGSADDDRMTSRALRSLTNQARMTSSPPATRE